MGAEWIRSINNTVRTYQGADVSPAEAYGCTVDGTREVASLAAELGVGILLENNENTATPDAPALAKLKADVGGVCRVGIAYDPVNAYFQGRDPLEGFEILAGQIDVMHMKNVRRQDEDRWDYLPRGNFSYEWTSLADGDLDWRDLLRRARQAGFDGPLTFEYVNPFKGMPLKYWDQLREPHEAARIEAEYLRKVLEEIQ